MIDDGEGYRVQSVTHPGWAVTDRHAEDYIACNHDDSFVGAPHGAQPEIVAILHKLRYGDLSDRAVRVREGREIAFFSSDWVVGRLVATLRKDSGAANIVRALLDELFLDLRKGALFEHAELVMALMYALRYSDNDLFDTLAGSLAKTKFAELSKLRRFAETLRR